MGTCLLLFAIVLILYYTQDFSSKIVFNDNLSFTSDYSEHYINWIESPIGEITLKNNGTFTEKYILPPYIGCIELRENSGLKLNEYEFEIYLKGVAGNEINVPIKKEIKYTLFARYYPRQKTLSFKQLEENVKGASIYEIKKVEKNPLRVDYNLNYPYETSQRRCERLKKEGTPIKTIKIDAI